MDITVSPDSPWWTVATACGTIGAAVATAAAVIVALVTAKSGRDAADRALREQLAAGDRRIRADHELDLLLSLQEQVATAVAYQHMPQSSLARERAAHILLALSSASDMPSTQLEHGGRFVDNTTASTAYRLRYNADTVKPDDLPRLTAAEIAERIRAVVAVGA